LALARTGTAMKPTRIGNRIVIIGSTAPADKQKAVSMPPSEQRPTTCRVVLIRNNEWVGNRLAR
jgi:hypothetical protein